MAETKWEDGECLSRAWIGDELAPVAWVLQASDDGAALIMNNQNGNEFLAMDRRADGRDAAKSAAEQALREMHGALAMHFAPVLRWQESAGGWVAFLGQWMLEADSLSWSVSIKSQASSSFKLVSWGETTLVTVRAVNRRAAEAALRSLGVTFRTEGER